MYISQESNFQVLIFLKLNNRKLKIFQIYTLFLQFKPLNRKKICTLLKSSLNCCHPCTCQRHDDETDKCEVGRAFVTKLCTGNPVLDNGEKHNHCRGCPAFGKCLNHHRQTKQSHDSTRFPLLISIQFIIYLVRCSVIYINIITSVRFPD